MRREGAGGWQKTLHALDPDLYFLYRAQPLGAMAHDTGVAPLATPLPARTLAVENAAVTVEVRPVAEIEGEGLRLDPADEFVADILHFRDVVFAEMNRVDAEDKRACISCHGVPGRVPTLYLDPPDAAGYIAPAEVERSKFLRKPLNIQSGQEDGHQGGTRYQADSAGYWIIREWVLKQAALQKR